MSEEEFKVNKATTILDMILVGTAIAMPVYNMLRDLVLSLTQDISEEELDKKIADTIGRIRFRNQKIQEM